MSQATDLVIANQAMPAARAEINSIFAALSTLNAGAVEPPYKGEHMLWLDISVTPWVLNVYGGGQWIPFLEVNAGTGAVNFINVAGGAARGDAASIAQIQDGAFSWLGALSGTNTITASLTPAIETYSAGQKFLGIAAGAPTGAVTLNINGVAAKAVHFKAAALTGGEWNAGDLLCFVYDGTEFNLISPVRNEAVSLPDGAVTTAKIAAKAVTPAKINADVNAMGSGSGARAIDLNNGRTITLTTSGNTSLSFSNWLASGQEDAAHIIVTYGGSHTLSFTGITLKRPGGTAYVPTASGTDELLVVTRDAGTNGVVYVVGKDVKS